MPTALDVNREAVRVLATAIGVREAARQMGLSQNTVMQWSRREKWFAEPDRPELPPTMQKQAVSNVRNPAEIMARYSEDSRLKLASVGNKLVSHFDQLEPEQLEARTGPIKDAAVILEKTHSWNRSSESAALVNITIQPGQHEQAPVIDIDGL